MSSLPPSAPLSLRLLGPFRAYRGRETVAITRSSARVLAYLALHSAASRSEVSGALWPEATQARASSDLRTALWRLQNTGEEFIQLSGQTLALPEHVWVDVDEVTAWATAVLDPAGAHDEIPALSPGCHRELLPGWDEEWLEHPRERIRMLTLQATEVAAERLLAAGRTAEALPFLLHVTQTDPFRESAQELLVRLHLMRRNLNQALRQYERYRELVWRDLGVEPGARLRALLAQYRRQATAE